MKSKADLKIWMWRFLNDPNKIISGELFAELAGVSYQSIKDVFMYKKYPVSHLMQIKVSRAAEKVEAGDVTVMMNRDRTRFVQYNQESKPPLKRETRLSFDGGEFKIKLGIVNRADYSRPTLKEELKGE
jgi:hypothetical protein